MEKPSPLTILIADPRDLHLADDRAESQHLRALFERADEKRLQRPLPPSSRWHRLMQRIGR